MPDENENGDDNGFATEKETRSEGPDSGDERRIESDDEDDGAFPTAPEA